ncbi:MAG: VWA domain-containing protein [Blastocatellia bacterium]|nr:VWA domain-containing protein [Blastocatellia bacterium]
MKSKIIIQLLLLLIVSSLPIYAQSGRRPITPGAEKTEDDAIVKVKTSEVLLTVTVQNQYGNLATGLSARDFIVIEDGSRQEITSFNVREAPINALLLLDASGSVFTEMKEIRSAAVKFVEQLRPDDKVAIIQFAEKVELIQNWTSNKADLKHAINWRYRPGEVTHLWDAVFLAAEEKMAQVDGRKAIIILTDCEDTESKVTKEQAYWATIKSGASVYVISKSQALATKIRTEYGGFGGRIAGTKGQADLVIDRLLAAESSMNTFAVKTGGRLYAPIKPEELALAYVQIAEELKNQYIITYTPTNEKRDGSFRALRVAVTRPGLVVNVKEGYVAPKDPTN